MTPKEAFEKILSYIHLDEYDYVTSGLLDAEQFIKKSLTELEELKRDVERYFELLELMDFDWENFTEHGFNELNAIETKLSKVGKDIGK